MTKNKVGASNIKLNVSTFKHIKLQHKPTGIRKEGSQMRVRNPCPLKMKKSRDLGVNLSYFTNLLRYQLIVSSF